MFWIANSLRHRLQSTESEDCGEGHLLPKPQVQVPDHWYWDAKHQKIQDKIGDTVPAEELNLVHALARLILVPEVRYRLASNNSQDSANNKVRNYQSHGSPYDFPELFIDAKYALVEQQD